MRSWETGGLAVFLTSRGQVGCFSPVGSQLSYRLHYLPLIAQQGMYRHLVNAVGTRSAERLFSPEWSELLPWLVQRHYVTGK